MKIRKATIKDLNSIVKLSLEEELYFKRKHGEDLYAFKNKKAHFQAIRGGLRQKKAICYVAEDKGRVVGNLWGSIWDAPVLKIKKGMLDDIFVTKKYRKQGIASKLKDAFFMWLKKKGIKYVLLEVDKDNKEAADAYKKWGFKLHKLKLLKELK